MNKAQLVEAVSKVVCTKKEAQDAVDTVFDSIARALKKGEPVTLVGFGSFHVRMRKARSGRNPQTGEVLRIPAKRVPAFRPGKKLRGTIG